MIDIVHVTRKPSITVKNLWVLLNSYLSFASHISLVGILPPMQHHTVDATRDANTHALLFSCIDFYNSQYIGLPPQLISRLHTYRTQPHQPILHDLHWFPISSRIKFKILLLTFKAPHVLTPRTSKNWYTGTFRPFSQGLSEADSSSLLILPNYHI